MHELSIAYDLVEIADEAARKAGAARVRTVHLRLGAMAGVVADALRFSFSIAAGGTLVAGAELVIEPVAVQVCCDVCAQPRVLEAPFVFRCPVCKQPVFTLIQGREIQIESIEIEESEAESQAESQAESEEKLDETTPS